MQSTFVKDVRKLREKEMQQYENKGYTILNKANYVFNDTINIEMDKEIFSFGIRVNINEVYFYILHGGSQIYLTIYEIYILLWNLLFEKNKECIFDAFTYYKRSKKEVDFIYRGQKYSVHKLPDNIPNDSVEVMDSDISISIKELILLIYLIQDKSNYFEGLSKEKKYTNGLIRLLNALLKCNNANSFLETLGWVFDANLGRYVLQKEKLVGERNRKRYYLTTAEERIIL